MQGSRQVVKFEWFQRQTLAHVVCLIETEEKQSHCCRTIWEQKCWILLEQTMSFSYTWYLVFFLLLMTMHTVLMSVDFILYRVTRFIQRLYIIKDDSIENLFNSLVSLGPRSLNPISKKKISWNKYLKVKSACPAVVFRGNWSVVLIDLFMFLFSLEAVLSLLLHHNK